MPAETTLYSLSNATLQQTGDEELVVCPIAPIWHNALVFAAIGLAILFINLALAPLAGLLMALAVFAAVGYPLSTRFSVDFQAGEVTYTADYLIHQPKHVLARFPLAQAIHVGFRPAALGRGQTVEVVMADGVMFVLQFGRRAESAKRFVEQLAARRLAATPLGAPETSPAATRRVTQALAANEVRSWSLWLLILGAAQLFAGPNAWPWGLLLMAVGVASYFLREPSMLMIYAATMAWSALTNVLFADIFWKVFAALQVFFTVQLVQQFLQSRPAAAPGVEPDWGRSGRVFPRLAAALGGLSLLGLALFIGIIFVDAVTVRSTSLIPVLRVVESLAVYCGLLGVAMGLAGWLGAYPNRRAARLGCLLGAVTLCVHLGAGLLGTR